MMQAVIKPMSIRLVISGDCGYPYVTYHLKIKYTIHSGKWLDDVIINVAHDMIHGQFTGINGFQQYPSSAIQ